MNIKQRLYLALAKSWWPHLTPLATKVSIGAVIFSSAAAPAVVPVVKHAHIFNKPIAPATTTVKPTPPPTPKKSTPPPTTTTQPSTPAPTVTVTKPSPSTVQIQQPTPLPTTSPSPGSGAKGLSTSTATSTSSGSGSGSTSSPSSSGSGPTDTTPATGGFMATNWSGYVATAGGYTSVSGEWLATNPTGNGTSTSGDSSWVGIGGANSQDLIQAGTMNIISSSGQVSTSAFYEMLPDAALTIPSLIITPGDDMTASIAETAANTWSITLKDLTSGQSYTTTTSYTSTHSSAEWIQEDPSYANGTLVPLDNFVKATFISGNTISAGTSLDLNASNAQPITMVDSSNKPIATPTLLSNNGFFVIQN